MALIDEIQLLDAFAARVMRINGAAPYTTDVGGRVLKQRIDFSSATDDMPLVGVVVHGGEFRDQGVSPRYSDQETQVELVGCIRAGDNTNPLQLLIDMKTAAFLPIADDVIDTCVSVLRADGWHVFLAEQGEAFTQVSLYLTARWGDDTVEQDS
jgi:hypothetical protein